MIILNEAGKTVGLGRSARFLLAPTNLIIPSGRRIALLGPSEEDKKGLIELLAGLVLPTAGRIIRKAQVSFPAGHLAGMSPNLSVRQNVAHIARLYGADSNEVTAFVGAALEQSPYYDRPFREFPGELRKRLGNVVTLSIPFDIYLLGDDIIHGEPTMNDKCYALFVERARDSGMIISTRKPQFALKHCDMAMLLQHGRLTMFDDVSEALTQLKASKPEPNRNFLLSE